MAEAAVEDAAAAEGAVEDAAAGRAASVATRRDWVEAAAGTTAPVFVEGSGVPEAVPAGRRPRLGAAAREAEMEEEEPEGTRKQLSE